MRFSLLPLSCAAAFIFTNCLAHGQQSSAAAAAIKGKKVCVADVANSSLMPIVTDSLKERLVEDLQKGKVNADDTSAVTLLANRLAISPRNKLAFEREKCDYMLLSEVAKSKGPPPGGNTGWSQPPASNGTGQSTAHLVIDFALFKRSHFSKPALENSVQVADSDDPNTAALAAIDSVAAQVAAGLASK